MSAVADHILKIVDYLGDEHIVEAGFHLYSGRIVYYDSDGYTPADARRLAAALIEAADLAENGIAVIPGGKK